MSLQKAEGLSVTNVVMNFRVAGLAQAHEVVPCVGAAFGNGQDVVNFLYRSQPAFPQTHLTERMLRRVSVPDALPRSAVLAVDVGASLVFVIFAALLYTVLLTELSFTEVGTARVRAGSERSSGHLLTSFGHKKRHRRISPAMALSLMLFH